MKHTKKALLASALSMLLCVSMLIGSTFAWFTDSVTSGKNQIVAGNLDVELEYATAEDAKDGTIADGDWKKVESTTNLFKADTLWEPGHTEYVYLRIRNAGSLALKYSLSAAVYGDETGGEEKSYTNVNGESVKLSDYLVFRAVDGTETVTDRSKLWIEGAEAEKTAMGKLDELTTPGAVLYPADKADDTHASQRTFTLAVYMPTQVDNKANWDGKGTAPEIYLGLVLNAAQTPFESDSFSDDYDAKTEFPDGAFTIAPFVDEAVPEAGKETVLGNEALTVTVPDGAVTDGSDGLVLEVEPENHVADGVTVLAEEKSVSYDIGLYTKTGHTEVVPSKAITVKLYIGEGLADVTVYHSGEKMDAKDVSYDAETGYLTLIINGFSQFDIVYSVTVATLTSDGQVTNLGTMASIRNAVANAGHGDTITLLRDITVTETPVECEALHLDTGKSPQKAAPTAAFGALSNGAIFDGNGRTVTLMPASSGANCLFAEITGGATVQNFTLEFSGNSYLTYHASDSHLKQINVTGSAVLDFDEALFVKNVDGGKDTVMTFESCSNYATVDGTNSDYSAIFAGDLVMANISFKDCTNFGNFNGKKAAMFLANSPMAWSGDDIYTMTIDNCSNEGQIVNLSDQYGPANLFSAVAIEKYTFETRINVSFGDETLIGAEALKNEAELIEKYNLGNPVVACKVDSTFEIKKTTFEDNMPGFTIVTASDLENVDHYVVTYTRMIGGTARQSMTWSFEHEEKNQEVKCGIYQYGFVDQEWINTHPNAVLGDDGFGHTTYKQPGYPFPHYPLPDLSVSLGNHEPHPADFISVTAYDADGNILSVIGLDLTRAGAPSSSKG